MVFFPISWLKSFLWYLRYQSKIFSVVSGKRREQIKYTYLVPSVTWLTWTTWWRRITREYVNYNLVFGRGSETIGSGNSTDEIEVDLRVSVLKPLQATLPVSLYKHLTSLRKPTFQATLLLVSPPNDVWETSAEIPYWWRVTTQIWVTLLIGWIKFTTGHNQSEALPWSG